MPPETIIVEGEDELAALTDLVLKRREYGSPITVAALERRDRLDEYRDAQDAPHQPTRRPMTDEVQVRVLRRFPDD